MIIIVFHYVVQCGYEGADTVCKCTLETNDIGNYCIGLRTATIFLTHAWNFKFLPRDCVFVGN